MTATAERLPPGLAEAVLGTGCSLDHFGGVVVVTSADSQEHWLRRLLELPHSFEVLALSIGGAETHPTPRVVRGKLSPAIAGDPALAAAVYRAIAAFVLARDLPLDRILYWYPEGPGEAAALVAEVQDFEVTFGDRFLTHASPETLADAFFARWAEHLSRSGSPLHALKTYWAIERAGVAPDAARTRSILRCLRTLECPDLALRWARNGTLPATERDREAARLEPLRSTLQNARAERRQRNLECLKARFPAVHARVLAHTTERRVHALRLTDVPHLLYCARQPPIQRAEYFVFLQETEKGLVQLNAPRNLLALYDRIRALKHRNDAHVLLGSLKSPEVFFNILRNRIAVPVPNYVQAVYALEPDIDLFSALLEVYDLEEPLCSDGLVLHVGRSAMQDLVDSFARRPLAHIPRMWFDVPSELGRTLQAVTAHRDERARQAVAANEAFYGEAFGPCVQTALTGARPLRVLLFGSYYTTVVQYVCRDLAQAFEGLGHRAVVFREQTAFESLERQHYPQAIAEARPDLLFLIGHLRPEFGSLIPRHLPVASWIQDNMSQLYDPAIIQALGSLDFVYTVIQGLTNTLPALGYPRVKLVPFAANAHIYAPRPDAPPARDEVAYITHVNLPIEPPSMPGLFRWLDHSLPELLATPEYAHLTETGVTWQAFDGYLMRMGRQALPEPERQSLHADVSRYARFVERVRYADWLRDADIALALYGSGWDEIPRFRRFARGPVEPGEALQRVYQESKVVLHVNRGMNLHNRVFEGFASGGFVIARREMNDDDPGGFAANMAIGTEIQLFWTRDELVNLVRRALSDDQWRQAGIVAGRKRVLREHTYENRVRGILDDIVEALRTR